MSLENDFNEHGAAGWEFCAVAKDYAIFKRPVGDEVPTSRGQPAAADSASAASRRVRT